MGLQNPLPNSILKKYPQGNITQWYGENPQLYSRYGMNGHNGIDIVTYEGDLIVASHDGIVIHADNRGDYGRAVYLFNENLAVMTNYTHLKDILCRTNEWVKAGDPIGTEGNTGFVVAGSTPYWGNAPAGKGVHLHFGLTTNCRKGVYDGIQHYFSSSNLTISIPLGQGINGWVDPMPYLGIKEMQVKLYQQKGRPEIFYKDIDGQYVWIPSMEELDRMNQKDWLVSTTPEEIDTPIYFGRVAGK